MADDCEIITEMQNENTPGLTHLLHHVFYSAFALLMLTDIMKGPAMGNPISQYPNFRNQYPLL